MKVRDRYISGAVPPAFSHSGFVCAFSRVRPVNRSHSEYRLPELSSVAQSTVWLERASRSWAEPAS